MKSAIAKRLTWAMAAVIAVSIMVDLAGPGSDVDLPRRFDTPGLALEAARNLEEAQAVTGPPAGPVWRAFRRQTYVDFLLLAAYGTALYLSGRLLALRGGRWRWLGLAGSGLAVAAALADAAENIGLLASVSDPVRYVDWLFACTRLKWACFGLSCAAVAPLWMPPLPWEHELKAFAWTAAVSQLAAAGLCLLGLFNPVLWERLAGPLALGWLIPAAILLWRRDWFLTLGSV